MEIDNTKADSVKNSSTVVYTNSDGTTKPLNLSSSSAWALYISDDGTFGFALKFMKQGWKLTRKGWNGKGQYVVYRTGYPEGIPANKNTADAIGIKEGELFKCQPYLQIRLVDGSFQMWAPSVSDCLAEDWEIVK